MLPARASRRHAGIREVVVLWPDETDAAAQPMYWAAEHGKRYFAAACTTGTIDQFLLSVLQAKHAHLRGTVLLRSLVVDEVHASDAYMTALLRAALDRHVRAGGHGLLMSATLTGEARASLLRAGQKASRGWAQPVDALAAPDAPYPCVSDARQQRAGARAAPQRRIQRECLPLMREPAAVAERVAGAVRGAHHARRDTGARLAELGFSEARLRQLIEADAALLCDLLPTLARRLAAARVTLDWRPLAEMALALDDESGQVRAQRARLLVVQGFLRASAAKASA